LSSFPVIKKGEAITCRACGEEIYKAAKDIPYMAPMASELLKYADGQPVEYAAALVCPSCGDRFDSISTERKETM
jgi:predicted RNA-binding Zn-ribbon protein involved in translation (DUF1610 family)